MERYLRTFVNAQHDDWPMYLVAAKFAADATKSDAAGFVLFENARDFLPRFNFSPPRALSPPMSTLSSLHQEIAKAIASRIQDLHDRATTSPQDAQEHMITQANKHRTDVTFDVGQKVWLNHRNLKLKTPSRKLTDKLSLVSYRKTLPQWLPVHKVFHAACSCCNLRVRCRGSGTRSRRQSKSTTSTNGKSLRSSTFASTATMAKLVPWTYLEWCPIDGFTLLGLFLLPSTANISYNEQSAH